MKKWKTADGSEIVRILGGRSNAYLISSGNGNILIDTGKKGHRKRLLENIGLVDTGNRGIDLLILTHSHFDHCGNAAYLRKEMNCKILLCKREAGYAGKGFTPLPKGTIGITRILARIGNMIGDRWFGYERFIPDISIDDKLDLKDYGYDIGIIATAGHSAGSVSVIVNHEIAIVGDAMFGIFRNSIFPPYADDIQKMVESWKRLLATGCSLFLPGHGKEIKRKIIENDYLKYAAL